MTNQQLIDSLFLNLERAEERAEACRKKGELDKAEEWEEVYARIAETLCELEELTISH